MWASRHKFSSLCFSVLNLRLHKINVCELKLESKCLKIFNTTVSVVCWLNFNHSVATKLLRYFTSCHKIAMLMYGCISNTSLLFVHQSSASFPGNPLPKTKQVIQCNNNPGGPIKLHSNTECDVNTPLFNPSSQIQRPTNKSHVRTWLHSSLTKFGYCKREMYRLYVENVYWLNI